MITPTLNGKALLLLLGMTAILMAASPMKAAVLVLLTLHALRGPRQVIEAFTVGIFLTISNPILGSGSSALRWPLLFAGFGRIVWDLTRHRQAVMDNAIIPLIFAIAASAIFFAPMVSIYADVSILKAVSFFIGTFTILSAFRLTAGQQDEWYSWFATFYAYIVLGSLPLLFMADSYLAGLFKGLFNHPQAFGAFLIPFTAWLLLVLARSEHRPRWLTGVVLLGLFWAYRTGSRTSVLAILLTVTVSLLVVLLRGGSWRATLVAGSRRLVVPVLFLTLVAAGLFGKRIVESTQAFLSKGKTEVNTVGSALDDSRGFLIDQQMANFRSSPLIGIGFGAPSDPEDLDVERSGFLNLPSGASVEKGFLPSAVLEEMGLVGAALVILLIGALLHAAWRQADPALLALLLGALLINAGEMIFFSPTALGAFLWLSAGLATTRYEAPSEARYAHRSVYVRPTSALDRLQQVA